MVLEDKFHLVFFFLQGEVDEIRFAVLGNIIQGFLHDPINDGFYRIGHLIFLDMDLRFDVDSRIGFLKFPTKSRAP